MTSRQHHHLLPLRQQQQQHSRQKKKQPQDQQQIHDAPDYDEENSISRNDHDILTSKKNQERIPSSSDRSPLCSLDTNSSSHTTVHLHSGGYREDGSTPKSSRSRGEAVEEGICSCPDPIKRRYVLSPHDHRDIDDDDDEDDGNHHDHDLNDVEKDRRGGAVDHIRSGTNVSMAETSIGNTTRHGDYDSVVYSGYAGSVSAAPSEWSDGYSFCDKHNKDPGDDELWCERDLQQQQQQQQQVGEPDEQNRNIWWSKRLNMVGGLGGNKKQSKRRKENISNSDRRAMESESSDCSSSYCSNKGSEYWMQMMQEMRNERRRKRVESMKECKATLLSEFRAFLKRNLVTGGDGDGDVHGSRSGSVKDRNMDPRTPPRKKCARERADSTEFTPTQIHGRIPWIVFQKDQEEDLSTIHGGSRCGGYNMESPTSNDPELYECLPPLDGANEEMPTRSPEDHAQSVKNRRMKALCSRGMSKRDRMAVIYVLLIVLSISALAAVTAIVIVRF